MKMFSYLNWRSNVYVYLSFEPRVWTVGFFKPDGTFEPESDYDTASDAAKRVHWLNGGNE